MVVQPYLNFDGRCDEAIEFYKTELDAKLTFLMRFKDNPEPHAPDKMPPGSENKVMHASISIGESVVMVSDGRCQGKPVFSGIMMSLKVSTDAEADKRFSGLSNGGKVTMPLAKTFFSSRFGMVTDRFGVSWMVLVMD